MLGGYYLYSSPNIAVNRLSIATLVDFF
jgi:hypothetical protein